MFLTVHTTAGIALGVATGNPLIAFSMGLISHYFLDMIPHGDEHIDKMIPDKYSPNIKIAIWAMGDFLIVFILFLTIFNDLILSAPVVLLAGALGAILPDILHGISMVFKLQILRPHDIFHNAAHRLLKNPIPFRYGIIVQSVFFAGLVYQLLY